MRDEQSAVLLAAPVLVSQALRVVVGLPVFRTVAKVGRVLLDLETLLRDVGELSSHVVAAGTSVEEVALDMLEAGEHPANGKGATLLLVDSRELGQSKRVDKERPAEHHGFVHESLGEQQADSTVQAAAAIEQCQHFEVVSLPLCRSGSGDWPDKLADLAHQVEDRSVRRHVVFGAVDIR